MQIYVNIAVLLIHNVDQNWFGPVVCHLKAITGEDGRSNHARAEMRDRLPL